VVYIDELDEEDNVARRLEATAEHRARGLVRPEVEWYADGHVTVTMFLPLEARKAGYAAVEIARRMGLEGPEVIHLLALHPSEGTLVEVKGRVSFDLDPAALEIPPVEETLGEEEIRREVARAGLKVVAATIGEDEHSVGMREIIDIKHGGLEKYGVECYYLGTSVPVEKVVDAALETGSRAILVSTIITHADVHLKNMRRLHELCLEKGVRDRLILVAGGTRVNDREARAAGMDAGFGRGTRGLQVASFLARRLREMEAAGRGGEDAG